ncbi:MAG: hypothetical protein EAZ57_05265 [Cytophagales bacterium]|nr:MAG: hypothetical protein EAZ67_06315 [Cytophagales bacterium]TAF60959.1 MAG: hypothetical protein EAZ57_05265 [Cytophagales bacterium]
MDSWTYTIKQLFLLLASLLIACLAQAQSAEGNKLIFLIGKPKSDANLQSFMQALGTPSPSLSTPQAMVYPDKGVKLMFYKDQLLSKIYLFGSSFTVNETSFKAYQGKLPERVTFIDTKETLILKLGLPSNEKHKMLEYNYSLATMLFVFNGDQLKSRLSYVEIRFKNCVEGNCQSGSGVWLDMDGSRYEGGWLNGKRHGDGKITLANGKIYEGYWENGKFKGKNFFKTNNLYDLLGKHKDSKTVIDLTQSHKDGYQKFQMAFDYMRYAFSQDRLLLYFDDYGFLYKIHIFKIGFKDFSHALTNKIKVAGDMSYVHYVMGKPVREEKSGFGTLWYYREGSYDLLIYFNTRKGIESIEIKLNDAYSVLDHSKGFCLKGDCQNGTGEQVSEVGKYVGKFKDGKFSGEGTLYLKSGGVYTGQFLNNKKHGSGSQRWSDQSYYNGQWVHGHIQGEGVMIYADKSRYEGQWLADKRHGVGSMLYPNGDKYVGIWRNNAPSGEGKMYYAKPIKQP